MAKIPSVRLTRTAHASAMHYCSIVLDEAQVRKLEADLSVALRLNLDRLNVDGGTMAIVHSARTAADLTVFIHGLNGTWRSWAPMLRTLLDDGFDIGDVMLLDFSGLRLPRTLSQLTEFGNSILRRIGDLGWSSVSLVGHSTGGSLAASMASSSPSFVHISNLRLISGLYVELFDANQQRFGYLRGKSGTARTLDKLRILAALGPLTDPLVHFASHSRSLRRAAAEGMYAHPVDAWDEVVRSQLASFEASALRDTLEIGRHYDPRRIYRQISQPVRLVFGEYDPIFREADAAVSSELIPNLVWHMVPDAGHFAHVERPGKTASLLWENN